MSEVAEVPVAEVIKNEFTIKNDGGVIEISSPQVDLASERESLKFAVALEKSPTPVTDGFQIENITIDRESPKLQEMIVQAQALKTIPERERPRKILELLRSNVQFAYTNVLEEVAKTNPELAQWVSENTGISSSSSKPLTLSEIVDKGYGVCRHLSVAMLVLAKEAGMEGAFLTYAPAMMGMEDKYFAKNVVRKDTGEPLFKMSGIGEDIGGHAWVELRTNDGEWIPVDPSTQLVGDTPEGLETFREANYRASVGFSMEMEGFPAHVGHNGNQDLWFLPGEQRHTGILEVNSQPRRKPIVISFNKPEETSEDKEQWPKPTVYKGPLKFSLSSHVANSGMTVAIAEAKHA